MRFLSLAVLVTILTTSNSAQAERCVPRSFSGGSHMAALTCFANAKAASKVTSQNTHAVPQSFSGGRASSFVIK